MGQAEGTEAETGKDTWIRDISRGGEASIMVERKRESVRETRDALRPAQNGGAP